MFIAAKTDDLYISFEHVGLYFYQRKSRTPILYTIRTHTSIMMVHHRKKKKSQNKIYYY